MSTGGCGVFRDVLLSIYFFYLFELRREESKTFFVIFGHKLQPFLPPRGRNLAGNVLQVYHIEKLREIFQHGKLDCDCLPKTARFAPLRRRLAAAKAAD